MQVERPVPAPTVTLLAAAQSAALQEASNSAKGQVSQGEKEGKEPVVKPDERTWIQKNWLPLALVGFMLFNRMGQAGQEPAGAQPPGARALPAGASRPASR